MDKLNHDKPMRPFPGQVYDQSDDTWWPRCPRRSESTVPGSQSRILWRPGPRVVKAWKAGKSLKIYRFSKVPIDTWLPTFGHFICFTLTSPFTRCTAVLIILPMVLIGFICRFCRFCRYWDSKRSAGQSRPAPQRRRLDPRGPAWQQAARYWVVWVVRVVPKYEE